LALSTFLAGSHERRKIVALKQTGNFGVGKKGVHTFKESRVKHVRLVHDETDLFTLAPTSSEDLSQIVVKVFSRILSVNLDLEDLQTVHPRDESRQRSLQLLATTLLNIEKQLTFPLPL